MNKLIMLCVFVVVGSFQANAATHEIKMKNMGADGMMVFEPGFLKASKGDTVKFIPADPSHDVSSVSVPKGAKAFHGTIDKPVTVKLETEGVYFYECKSHVTMAMVGVIQVGKPDNLEEAKKAAKTVAAQFVTNKDRADKYLAQVK